MSILIWLIKNLLWIDMLIVSVVVGELGLWIYNRRRKMITHTLPDAGWIEASSEIRGGKLRLRARLAEPDGLVKKSLLHTYAANDPNALHSFTREWEGLTGITLEHPLFIDASRPDLRAEIEADAASNEIEGHRNRMFMME